MVLEQEMGHAPVSLSIDSQHAQLKGPEIRDIYVFYKFDFVKLPLKEHENYFLARPAIR